MKILWGICFLSIVGAVIEAPLAMLGFAVVYLGAVWAFEWLLDRGDQDDSRGPP